MSRIDENELRALFEEIEAPDSLDRWRERIADVHAAELDEPPQSNGAKVITLPTDRELRPHRPTKRSVAVAAAAAVLVGLAGVVVTTQLLSDAPPADPTMIIDGPDNNTATSLPPPTSRDENNSGTTTTPPPSSGPDQPNSNGETPGGDRPNDTGGTDIPEGPSGNEPSWPAMVGDPTAANTGVPLAASLADHQGDLRITTAGQVVADLRVNGSVIVDAPNVTLKRVQVVASYGAPAVRQNAANLTIENSELSGGSSVAQSASGLVVRRSRLESGVTITSGAELYDSFLNTADVLIPSGANSVLLRHSVMGRVTMNDLDAPIRGVTIENSLLTQVDAPTDPGSASIHVLGNRFRSSAPSTGWDPNATDYVWADNTNADTGASVHW
ncbi:hypothetical protein [Actinophytocola sp.]|uniref:hypothetical protein n=1 Tax=Actinophytocola sp. TaxID=1872138 RepID=UPI002ED2446D